MTAHPDDFIDAYNYRRRSRALHGLTPCEYICKCWVSELERVALNPHRQMPRRNI
ncbi:IS3 family transposase [Sphingomonas sp. KC8]|uniref:IS3 family transposase n=1 Tax=Sphingomonas sp. KC8 TaxID=1030157 RepID=UPI0012FC2C83